MSGGAAELGNNAGDFHALEGHRLRRQNFRGHQNDGFFEIDSAVAILEGELGGNATQDVADVGHALAQIVVFDLGKKAGVFVQRFLKGRASIHVVIEDGRPDFLNQGGVAEQKPVRAENAGLFIPHLLADASDNCVQLLGRGGTSAGKPIYLS